MVAATAVANPPQQRITLYGIAWETYEGLLGLFSDRSVPHFAYNQGVLEIVSPLPEHEENNQALAQVVTTVAEELGVEYRPVGATTYRRKWLQKGFEADSSFYLRDERFVLDLAEIDPTVDPPPDLVIEVDVTHSTLAKLDIYADFGVPEVWHCPGDRVAILVLEAGAYREVAVSRVLPPLTSEVLTRFLVESRSQRRLAWLRAIRSWVRDHGSEDAASGRTG